MNDQDFNVMFEWWKDLEEKDKGGRAELRRARSPEELVFCSAYHRLYRKEVKGHPLEVPCQEGNLKKLKYEGRIKRIGPDKGGHWEVISNDRKEENIRH